MLEEIKLALIEVYSKAYAPKAGKSVSVSLSFARVHTDQV